MQSYTPDTAASAPAVTGLDPTQLEDIDDIPVDKFGVLARSYMSSEALTNMLLKGYNYFLEHELPRMTMAKLRVETGSLTIKVSENGVRLMNPHIVDPSNPGKIIPHGPTISILESSTYESNILVSFECTQNITDRGVKKVHKVSVPDVLIGKIPIMVGCNYCNIKDPADADALGESDTVPPGYFVAKGQKRIAPTFEHLRTNLWLYYNVGDSKVGVYTAQSETTTDVVSLSYDPKTKSVNVFVTGFSSPDDPIPIFVLIHYLARTNTSDDHPEGYPLTKHEMLDMILRYTEHPDAVTRVLLPSFVTYDNTAKNMSAVFKNIVRMKPEERSKFYQGDMMSEEERERYEQMTVKQKAEYDQRIAAEKAEFDRMSKAKKAEFIKSKRANITEEEALAAITMLVFPNMNSGEEFAVQKKIENLCLGIAGYAERLAGIKPTYNRDSYGVKRCETITTKYRSLMSKCLKSLGESAAKKFEGDQKTPLSEQTIRAAFSHSDITNVFTRAVHSGEWGTKSQYTKTNVTELLKADSYVSYYSQIMRVSRPVGERTKGDAVRTNQRTQVGYVSLAHTPESAKVGLVLCAASGCFFSHNEDESMILSYLESVRYNPDEPSESAMWSERYEDQFVVPLILNGRILGHCVPEIYSYLLQVRRTRLNDSRMSVCLTRENTVTIYTDADRPTRPLLVVDQETSNAVIELYDTTPDSELPELCERLYPNGDDGYGLSETIKALKQEVLTSTRGKTDSLWYAPFPSLYNLGVLEFVDAFEIEFGTTLISYNLEHLNDVRDTIYKLMEDEDPVALEEYLKHHRYTHCEIDPTLIMSPAEATTPFAQHSQAPRITYECKMINQALSTPNSNNGLRFETNSKYATRATRPLVETQIYKNLNMHKVGSVHEIILAIAPFYGHSIEDAFVVKKSAIERGFGATVKESTYWAEERDDKVRGNKGNTKFVLSYPIIPHGAEPDSYSKLNPNGLPILGAHVKAGDCLIGMVRVTTDENGKVVKRSDVSVFVEPGAEGFVDRVVITKNESSARTIGVRIRQERKLKYGDKVARRHAQKTTCGLIVEDSMMPITADGIVPDVMINPLCIHSRMTIGMLLEMVFGKIAALTGIRANATAFRRFDIRDLKAKLESLGYDGSGSEEMYSQITGEKMKGRIMIAPVAEQILTHQVDDKYQARSMGARNPTTGQPVTGKAKQGGLKNGEMERDAYRSANTPYLVHEFYCTKSDPVNMVVCSYCGSRAIYNEANSIEICPVCGTNENLGRLITTTASENIRASLASIGIQMEFGYEELD